MGYLNCPGIHNVVKMLKIQGHKLADRNITSDSLTGIELLIGVDYFAQFITRQKRASGISLFVTRGGGVIPFGTIPKWALNNESTPYTEHYTCARIICESKPELELTELWDLERIGITQDNLSPSERETVSIVRSSLEKSDKGYIVRLPFKDESRPSVNYRNAKGQLDSLIQRVSHDKNLGQQYDEIVNTYLEKDFIEEIPSEPIAGHHLPHHPVFKKSATTPVRIVFNASSKPTDGTSLNDCLLTGPSLTAKLHEILLTFRKGKLAVTADISKAFHRIIVNEQDRDYLKFLWFNLETEEQRMFRFHVVMFGATCSPYLLQETLQTHLSENVAGREFSDKFYVDNYMNTYDRECGLICSKPKLDELMNEAHMPLQEWVSSSEMFNFMHNTAPPATQNVLGLEWDRRLDQLKVVVSQKLMNEASWKFSKRNALTLISSLFDPLGLLSPLSIIRGRIFLQTLWKAKVNWDESLSEEHANILIEILREFQRASEFSFPRRVVFESVELHVFVDASTKAYGAAAYVVDTNTRSSNILASKARVAPCKANRLTIPKLELTATLIGCRLIKHLNSLFSFVRFYLWTDSKVAISWVSSSKDIKDIYVANCIAEIQSLTISLGIHIMHVPTETNPADLLSR